VALGELTPAGELITDAQRMLAAFPDGVEDLRDRLDRLSQRIAAPHRVVPRGSALTEREVVVLRLLRGTMSLREIGQELYVSPNTVKSHAQAIYRKLGVSTRHDAVERGHESGVL
jgi:LuxR family maltose regulon positive regulatory protein